MAKRATKVKRLRQRLTLVVALFVLLLSPELAARWWLNHSPTIRAYRLSRPPPYQQSAYWSPEFVAEEYAVPWYLSDGGFWLPLDFQGRWYRTQGGVRQNLYMPTTWTHTIYMLGNSTLFDAQVPDEDTIANRLQVLLNQHHVSYRVVNMGMDGGNTAQQVLRLKTLHLDPGDVVIFYDGVDQGNEVYDSATLPVCMDDTNKPALIIFFCHWTPPPGLTDPTWIQNTSQRISEHYRQLLIDANAYVRQSGATMYHFLQPQIWSKRLSPAEESMLSNHIFAQAGLDRAFISIWPMLQAVTLSTASTGIISADLTHVLDNIRSSGQDVYIDVWHVNEVADAIIAPAIFRTLYVF